nr:protein FAR1-related sequence 5-like [Tanacetum cinerariifolium]
NQFFPPSKTTSLRNEITNFQQRFDESFSEVYDRFKDLLRACAHRGFLELHQLDTFYNSLNSKDRDSLNSAAGGNFLDKMPRDCLSIIKSKSKVRYSRDKLVVAKVSTNASTFGVSPDVAELKDMVKALLLDKKSLINIGCDSFASHDDNASFYWVPRVFASVLLVLGTVYDNLDECIEMEGCPKDVWWNTLDPKKNDRHVREGCLKDVWWNTLDPKKNDRHVRSLNFRVCGCKACVLFDMVPHTTKYTLTTFDVEHNHELDRVKYKYLSKAERKLTYNEAANANIGVVRAHNLYTDFKDSSSLVHDTQTEFKNFTCGVNCFIKDSDTQMLITRMEERQEFTKDFSFDYFVKDAEFCGLFWVDEVAKCNYKELGDIASSGSFTALAVTDQDGAMRLAIAAEFPESKHRLCVSLNEGCTVCIIDEKKIKPVGLPEVIDNESTSENVEEEINMHQKVIGHYK